jgi:DNA-binding transcriptional ArsR family regulator
MAVHGASQTIGPLDQWPGDDLSYGVDLGATARYFRVLGDPTRLGILRLLAERRHNVTELCLELRASQSNVSNHLACLRWCELVRATRIGREQIYELTDHRIPTLIDDVLAMIDGDVAARLRSCRRLGS